MSREFLLKDLRESMRADLERFFAAAGTSASDRMECVEVDSSTGRYMATHSDLPAADAGEWWETCDIGKGQRWDGVQSLPEGWPADLWTSVAPIIADTVQDQALERTEVEEG